MLFHVGFFTSRVTFSLTFVLILKLFAASARVPWCYVRGTHDDRGFPHDRLVHRGRCSHSLWITILPTTKTLPRRVNVDFYNRRNRGVNSLGRAKIFGATSLSIPLFVVRTPSGSSFRRLA